MATIRIAIQAEDRARRELEQTRRQITSLNQQVAVNNRLAVDANDERRKSLRTINMRLRAEQGLLRVQAQRQAALLPGLREEIRATTDAVRATGRLSGVFSTLGGNIASIGIDLLTRGLTDFARGSVDAAVRVEGFRNSLTALYGDAQIANTVLADLRDLAQLPGITFEGAIQGAIRLKTVGVEGERANAVIREFGNAAALSGASSIEMGRALVGLTQTLSRGQIEQDNLNQILENVPIIGNAIQESFNSIDAENIREQLDAAGQSTQDFADILINQLSMGARASADSTANAFSNLKNATFELQAAIGEGLVESVRGATTGLTGLLSALTDLIRGNSFATKSADDFSEAVSGTTESVRDLLPELDEYIRRIEQQQRSRGGISSEQLEALNEAKDLYNLVSSAVEGNTTAISQLESRTQTAKDALDAHNAEQERLKRAIDAVDPSIRSERDSLTGLNQDLAANTQRIEDAQTEYDNLRRVLTSVTEETNTLKESVLGIEQPTLDASTATRGFISAVEDSDTTLSQIDTRFLSYQERVEAYTGAIRQLPPAITAVRDDFDLLFPTAERVNKIFEDFRPTLVDAQTESTALSTVSKQLTQDLDDQTGLAHATDVVNRRIDGFVRNAKLVNPAITAAAVSVRDYVKVLEDLDVGYQDVEEIQEDVTEKVRNTATAFNKLRMETGATEPTLDAVDAAFESIAKTIESDLLMDLIDLTEQFGGFGAVVERNVQGAIDLIGQFDTALGNALGNLANLLSTASQGNVLGTFAQLPGLVQSLNATQDFTDSPFTDGGVLDQAQAIISQIERSDLSFDQRRSLIDPIVLYVEEVLTRSILSADAAFAPALSAQFTALARDFGIDFDFDESRERFGLQDTAFGTPFEGVTSSLGDVVTRLDGIIARQQTIEDQQGRRRRDTPDAETEGTSAQGSSNLVRFEPATGRRPGARFNAELGIFEQIPTAGSEAGAPIDSRDPTALLEEIAENTAPIADVAENTGSIPPIAENTAMTAERTGMTAENTNSIEDLSTTLDLQMGDVPIDRERPRPEEPLATLEPEIIADAVTQGVIEGLGDNTVTSELFQIPRSDPRIIPQEDTRPEGLFADPTSRRVPEVIAMDAEEIPEAIAPAITEVAIETVDEIVEEIERRDIGNALLENQLQRSLFRLEGAESEDDFEQRRRSAINLTNQYYDAESDRLRGLGLQEDELQDKIEDSDLMRDRAIRRLTDLTNTFAEDRIREEGRVADEIIRQTEIIADERIREEERVMREQERLREDRLRAEERLADEIASLQERGADIQQRAEFGRADIRLSGARSREDLNIQTRRAIEDLFREQGVASGDFGGQDFFISQFLDVAGSSTQLRGNALQSLFSDTDFRQQGQIGSFQFDQLIESRLSDILLGFGRSREDIALDESRRLEDTDITEERGLEEIQEALAMAGMAAGTNLESSAITAGQTLETSAANAGSVIEQAAGEIALAVASRSSQAEQPIEIHINTSVEIDAQIVGRIIDKVLVELDKDNQTFGSYLSAEPP